MPANQNAAEPATDGHEPSDEPESYHPARNVSPEAVEQAMAALDEAELEAMNRASAADLDDAERVLVSLDSQCAEYVRRHAWEVDREPGAVLDDLIRYANVHYEDALDPREQDP
jgi:hypothetical protein